MVEGITTEIEQDFDEDLEIEEDLEEPEEDFD